MPSALSRVRSMCRSVVCLHLHVPNLYYNGPIKIILGSPRKTSPAESLQPFCTQKNAHKNSSLLKSRANKTPKPNSMATILRVMPGFSPPRPPRTPHAMTRRDCDLTLEANHHRIKKTHSKPSRPPPRRSTLKHSDHPRPRPHPSWRGGGSCGARTHPRPSRRGEGSRDASATESCTSAPLLLPPRLLLFPTYAVADAAHGPTSGCARGLHRFLPLPPLIHRSCRHRLLILLLLHLDMRAAIGGPREGAQIGTRVRSEMDGRGGRARGHGRAVLSISPQTLA